MKRHLLIIGMFLLLGAVVNVAVAWGCALWSPRPSWGTLLEPSIAAEVLTKNFRFDGRVEDFSVTRAERLGFSLFYARRTNDEVEDLRFVIHPGWPLRCLAGEARWTMLSGIVSETEYVGAVGAPSAIGPFPIDDAPYRAFVLRPIWPGFAINTVFYATLLWLLMYGLSALRRFVRVRRGLCPKCAYPMGESAVCTECGGALPKRAVAGMKPS